MYGRMPLRDYPAHRIALIKPSALGDIIHSLPVLSALRRRYPEAHITWVVNRTYEPLLQGHPDLDATLPVDRGLSSARIGRIVWNYCRLYRSLRQQRFDLVIDLQGLFRSGLMTMATGATRRVGLNSAREGAAWFYTDVLPGADRMKVHAVDRYWRVAEALGVGDVPKSFHVPIPQEARQWAARTLQHLPRPWLMLGVGARWITKRWPPEQFAALARQAHERFGASVVLVGGRDELPLSQAVARTLTGPTCDLTARTTLPQLAAVLAEADAMLANDTGPLHLAAALGRPVVAPYTCTKAALTGPYGGHSVAVETRVWCQGSYVKRCSRLECMTELTPDRLWPYLEKVLLRWRSRSRSA
jgi:lipopolysaccharide heptosyltransferase I